MIMTNDTPYTYGFKANGNVKPARFVKLDTTVDWGVLQAGAGDVIFGVSEATHRNPPYLTLDDGYTAVSSEGLGVATAGKICLLQAGGSITRGDKLKPDSDGQGVTTTTAGDIIGAIALQSASGSGVLIRVQLIQPTTYSTY